MSASSISNLYTHIGYWHNRFGRQVELAFERRLKKYAVTLSQWSVMVIIYHQQAKTVREIAKMISLDGGAVSRLADRLQKKGLIKRLTDTNDARSIHLELTAKAKRLISKLAAEADLNDEQFFGVLNATEIQRYKTLLTKLLITHDANAPLSRTWAQQPLKRSTQQEKHREP